jgi:hypothetical protein
MSRGRVVTLREAGRRLADPPSRRYPKGRPISPSQVRVLARQHGYKLVELDDPKCSTGIHLNTVAALRRKRAQA